MTEIDVPLDTIILDSRLQMRATMDFATIDEYAEAIDSLPPGKIVMGESGEMWLTGGWHRYHAHGKAKRDKMKCAVREGTFQDALKEAAGENHGHGIKRTDADKRRAVTALLSDDKWKDRSDRMIAEACHVSPTFVGKVRAENPRVHVDTSPQRTDSIGRSQPAKKPKREIPRCTRCIRLWPTSENSRPGCVECFELRKKARKPGDTEPDIQETNETPPKPLVDDAGTPIPEGLLPVFRMVKHFKRFEVALNSAAKLAKDIENVAPLKAKKPLGGKKHYGEMFGAIKNARWRVKAMRPALVCTCGGEGCVECGQTGYLTSEEVRAAEEAQGVPI